MSEQTSQEPTMEEILASIRRIISEDDAPPGEAADAAPPAEAAVEAKPEPEPAAVAAPAPTVEPEPEEEPLELTDRVETVGDLDVYTPPAASPAPTPAAAPAPPVESPAPVFAAAPSPVETLVSASAASVAASAFTQLSAAVSMPKEGRTLEDVVREMLRPMLQQWLDQNLPAIVQQAVETEVDRIARSRLR